MKQSSKLLIIFIPILIITTIIIGSIFSKEIDKFIGLPTAANYITLFTILGEIIQFFIRWLDSHEEQQKKENYKLSNIVLH